MSDPEVVAHHGKDVAAMDDNQDRVQDAISAAMAFVLTDQVYGPNDPRTRQKKEHLAQRLNVLISREREVEPSPLRVVRGDLGEQEPLSPFRAPVRDDRCWTQVRACLIGERQLPEHWIDDLYRRGRVYADERGRAVFIREDGQMPTGAVVQGMWAEKAYLGLEPGTRCDEGWFSVAVPDLDNSSPPTLILAQSPIEALSCLEVHCRLYRDRPDGLNDNGPVKAISMDAVEGVVNGVPHDAIRETLERGGVVLVKVEQGEVGERVWQQVHEGYPQARVRRAMAYQQDWNGVLRYTNLCRSDPEAATRRAHEMQRQNPPSVESREAVREAVRRLGPDRDRGRDGWDR
jgi:hypothetical protein